MSFRPAIAELPGYEILSPLSSGGMGDVLLARRKGAFGFEKLVAIKTIRPDLAPLETARAMFLDEARVLSRLTHPAIAQLFDFGEIEGALYLVLEYVPGVSFARLYELPGGITPGLAARLIAEVCRGLHAAHELVDSAGKPLGIVHRDVSPENLLLGFEGRVKVLDFGIALVRGRSAPVTQIGQIRGKPAYLSPEQLLGERIDRRADVYSAASVLYELLIGRRRFTGQPLEVVFEAVVAEPAKPPSALGAKCPPELEQIVLHGLEREPSRRYETARQMAEALEAVATQLGAEPLEEFAERALAKETRAHGAMVKRLLDESRSRDTSPSLSPPAVAAARSEAATLAERGSGRDDGAEAWREAAPTSPPAAGGEARGREPSPDPSPGGPAGWPGGPGPREVERASTILLPPSRLFEVAKRPSPETATRSAPEGTAGRPPRAAVSPALPFGEPTEAMGAAVDPGAPAPVIPAPAPERVKLPPLAVYFGIGTALATAAAIVLIRSPPPPRGHAPRPPVTAPGEATLTIAGGAGARVVLDGAVLGTTPLHAVPISPGRHHLRCVNEASGVVLLDDLIYFKAGEHRRFELPRSP